ncbi:YhcH/YjgK/YiaL family protein [Ferruginibacter albus]|uniref:YhcH/YjgK/YiaL family protein n=1 Tax=Ferruginibacter albus TaxID=2875540 RepID=UPI001CC522D5|nr:YhcH/YjgK/YiaL family protein [Ferruginibacter albus]UAY53480.1 YhcH/YjgK/YiaL family protein [Ferruginibacter albus]
MIIDSLQNADKYISLHPRFAKAFEFIKGLNLEALEVGKYEIDGKDLHAGVSLKDGMKPEEGKFEAHENYIDIQVCPTGKETIGWKPKEKCVSPKGEYNAEKDVTFYSDAPDTFFELTAGQFAIFYPNDVHIPNLGEGPIKKLVVKVKI